MTNKEILQKAIEKAQKKGYFPFWTPKDGIRDDWYYSLPFSHDFAKAFWGTGSREDKNYMDNIMPMDLWMYHLQKMVLEENPIKYLEQFLPKESLEDSSQQGINDKEEIR